MQITVQKLSKKAIAEAIQSVKYQALNKIDAELRERVRSGLMETFPFLTHQDSFSIYQQLLGNLTHRILIPTNTVPDSVVPLRQRLQPEIDAAQKEEQRITEEAATLEGLVNSSSGIAEAKARLQEVGIELVIQPISAPIHPAETLLAQILQEEAAELV